MPGDEHHSTFAPPLGAAEGRVVVTVMKVCQVHTLNYLLFLLQILIVELSIACQQTLSTKCSLNPIPNSILVKIPYTPRSRIQHWRTEQGKSSIEFTRNQAACRVSTLRCSGGRITLTIVKSHVESHTLVIFDA